jgi:nucleotide-binding universal stress UspA family protein
MLIFSMLTAKGNALFHNILVSIDGSPHSDEALRQAIDIALADRSRVTLLTAVRRCPAWAYSPVSAAAVQQLATDLEREAQRVMCQAVERVPQSVPVTKIVTHKPIRTALMRRIKSGHHDLLVMGSRGRGGLKASLLGSVSHYVLGHSPIPVLIAQAPGDGARPGDGHARPRPEAAPAKPGIQAGGTASAGAGA